MAPSLRTAPPRDPADRDRNQDHDRIVGQHRPHERLHGRRPIRGRVRHADRCGDERVGVDACRSPFEGSPSDGERVRGHGRQGPTAAAGPDSPKTSSPSRLEGRDLESLVREFGLQPSARVIFLLKQICHSLAEAHPRGMVHRDITPANIFLCRRR